MIRQLLSGLGAFSCPPPYYHGLFWIIKIMSINLSYVMHFRAMGYEEELGTDSEIENKKNKKEN